MQNKQLLVLIIAICVLSVGVILGHMAVRSNTQAIQENTQMLVNQRIFNTFLVNKLEIDVQPAQPTE